MEKIGAVECANIRYNGKERYVTVHLYSTNLA